MSGERASPHRHRSGIGIEGWAVDNTPGPAPAMARAPVASARNAAADRPGGCIEARPTLLSPERRAPIPRHHAPRARQRPGRRLRQRRPGLLLFAASRCRIRQHFKASRARLPSRRSAGSEIEITAVEPGSVLVSRMAAAGPGPLANGTRRAHERRGQASRNKPHCQLDVLDRQGPPPWRSLYIRALRPRLRRSIPKSSVAKPV